MRADSHNGYISQFECYTGKKGDTAEVGLGRNVVKQLTRGLVGKNYHTFTWTTSFHLCLYIKAYYSIKYVCSMGTLCSNHRYFPPELKPLVKKGIARKGDWAVRQEGNTSVTVWQDIRPVVSISTGGHNPAGTQAVTRGKGKNMKYLDCSESIFDYIQSFHGRGRYKGPT